MPSEIVERFRFHTRSRLKDESVADFVAALRAIAILETVWIRESLNSLDLRNGGVALYLENFNRLNCQTYHLFGREATSCRPNASPGSP